jgi:ubiquinone/menaquinone biosynthesis C-methylase UbiE
MTAFDAEQYRQRCIEQWEGAASGWSRRRQEVEAFAQPVTQRLIELLELQDGDRVLDLAAGLGETGLLAAKGVGANGSVLISDQAEAMLSAARKRAGELRLLNVEVRRIDAEWIDLPLSSVDAIVCRWALMLMADPDAALRECRRVLCPGGRISLAVWDSPARNPWASAPAMVLAERGLATQSASQPGVFQPGMFALCDTEALAQRIAGAGFTDVSIESVALTRSHESFEEFWEMTLDVSVSVHDAVMSCPQSEIQQIRDAIEASLLPYTEPDGAMEIPASCLVARADA